MVAVAGLLEASQEPRPPGLRRVRTASELPKGKLGLASLALPTRLLVDLWSDRPRAMLPPGLRCRGDRPAPPL